MQDSSSTQAGLSPRLPRFIGFSGASLPFALEGLSSIDQMELIAPHPATLEECVIEMSLAQEDLPAGVLALYPSARAEIVQQIVLRDEVLLASVTANGVVAGIGFKDLHKGLLLFIPWISLASAMALFRHDYVIRRLGAYIKTELRRHWTEVGLVDFNGWLGNDKRDWPVYLLKERFLFAVITCGHRLRRYGRSMVMLKYRGSYGLAIFALACTIAFFGYLSIEEMREH